MVSPILLVTLGTVSLGLAESIVSKLLKKYPEVSAVGLILVGSVVSIFLTLVWLFVFQIDLVEISLRTTLLMLLTGGIYYFANKFFYSSYKTESASTVAVFVMLSIVVSSIFGQLVFNEQISAMQWVGIAIVVGAVFFYNTDGVLRNFWKGVLSPSPAKRGAIFAAFLFGLGFSFSKYLIQDINPHYYQFLYISMTLPLYFVLDYKNVIAQVKVVSRGKIFWTFAPVIILYFFYNKAKYVAFSMDIALPVADAIDNTVVFTILAVEFFVFRLKQDNYLFKLLTSIAAFIGVLLIGLS